MKVSKIVTLLAPLAVALSRPGLVYAHGCGGACKADIGVCADAAAIADDQGDDGDDDDGGDQGGEHSMPPLAV